MKIQFGRTYIYRPSSRLKRNLERKRKLCYRRSCCAGDLTLAVGIWTAMEGVGSRPEAVAWRACGCMGLSAPCKTHISNPQCTVDQGPNSVLSCRFGVDCGLTASVKPDCWLACSSCFCREMPAPEMKPAQQPNQELNYYYPCAFNTLVNSKL